MKFKTKILKKLDLLKQFFISINFKKLIISVTKTKLKLLTAFTLFTLFFSTTVIKIPVLHKKMLKHFIGKNVVKLVSGGGTGTGFYIEAPSGEIFILTNKHICDGSIGGKLIEYNRKGETLLQDIVKISKDHDLCLVTTKNKEGLSLASSGELFEADQAFVIGHPRGLPLRIQEGRIMGEVDAIFPWLLDIPMAKKSLRESSVIIIPETLPKNQLKTILRKYKLRTHKALQMNLLIAPGNSGSPVIDATGDVIGVVFAGSTRFLTNGYAVPYSEIKKFLKDF